MQAILPASSFQEEEECEGDCTTGDIPFEELGASDQLRKKQMQHNFGARQQSRQDRSYPAECKIDIWGPWSPCNSTCGPGVRVKSRSVWNKKLQHKNSFRPNDNINDICGRIPREETLPCNEGDCREKDPICFEIPKPIDCGRKLKAYWYYDVGEKGCAVFFDGDCSKNIRNKFATKELCEKKCPNEDQLINFHMMKGGFDDMEIGSLRLQPVNCSVTDWQITACNATCGTGYQRKTRKILRQAKHGGKPCPNRLEKIYKCWVQCPMDEFSRHQARSRQNERQVLEFNCEYSNWSPWTPCSKTCGENARRQRTRYLLNPEYSSKCRDRLQSEVCLLPPCSQETCEGMFC